MRVSPPRPFDLTVLTELAEERTERPASEPLYARVPAARRREPQPLARDTGDADYEVDFFVR